MAAKKAQEKTYTVSNPATFEPVATYPLMSPGEVDQAVKRAKAAFPSWSQSAISQRQAILKRAAAVLAENAAEYARQIAAENGKTAMDAMLADIFSTAHLLSHYGKKLGKYLAPVKVEGTLLFPGRKTYYVFEPKGVVGVISPWNYPFTLSAGPVISAVAAGNSVVLKPSSQTTRSGLIVKEIFVKAGLPPDVAQVVTGSGSHTGDALASHPGLDMLFFTGSTEIGNKINVKAAERLIPVIMELGGKDVAIVTKNADIDRAVSGTAWGAFTNCGQTCIGTEIILVDKSIFTLFAEKLARHAGGIKTGMGCGEVGAMTMDSQFRLVIEQLEDAVAKGATVLAGGKPEEGRTGRFFPPTVLTGTTPDMRVRTEETFGPLKCLIPFDTVDEAIAIANASEYGLSASVYTRDPKEGKALAARLKTGSVNINDALVTYAVPSLPFGGVKKSGIGRYHGAIGLQAFTDIKSVTEFYWPLKREFFWYPIPKETETLFPHLMVMMFGQKAADKLKAAGSAVRVAAGSLAARL
jgi:acyl-CoA reductase-like NAD-dependent aldehyde dehydrogenase